MKLSYLFCSFIILSILLCFAAIGTLAAHLTVDLSKACNRTYLSPWPNQEEFGYREWFKNTMILHDEILFEIEKDGKILTLKPQNSVQINLPHSREIEGISLLCSANFTYKEPLNFTIGIISDHSPDPVVLKAKAYEWYPWVNPKELIREYVVERFHIFADGRFAQGLLGYEHIEYEGRVKSIQIRNNNAKELQHLMIAAITLHTKEQLPV